MKVEHVLGAGTAKLYEIRPGECFRFADKKSPYVYMRIRGRNDRDFIPGDEIRYILLSDGSEFKSTAADAPVIFLPMKVVDDV